MNTLTRLALAVVLAAAPLAACTQPEADRAGDQAENAAADARDAAVDAAGDAGRAVDSAADATGEAVREGASETREAVDGVTTTTEQTTVRTGENGVEVTRSETR